MRWDPLQPDPPDLTEAHAPMDGTDGVVVGDDSDTALQPRVRAGRGRLPWWVLYVVALLAVVALLLTFAPLVVGGAPPDRAPAACRCGTRVPDSPRPHPHHHHYTRGVCRAV